MKAFVIKNKEGKYFVNTYCWAEKICNAYICDDKDSLEKLKELYLLTDCKVVEITISEGNLEQENKQLEEQHDLLIDEFQKERENLCKQIKQESDARERFVKKVKQLKEQLAIREKALELACEKLPMCAEYCCNSPERYNLQDEYGSDEPYWVEEGGCEFDSPEHCLSCIEKYFIEQAKEI